MARKVIRTTTPPSGLSYVPDFITEEEERLLIPILAALPYYDFVLQGVVAKRKVIHFGFGYQFYAQKVERKDPFPAWLAELRDRVAPIAGLDPNVIEQALVNKYDPGAGIGWHRDAPPFGPTVIGISIGTDEVMRFRRQVGDNFEMYKQPLARRSLYVLSGSSRAYWQHSLPAAKELRYSITFRTVKEKFKGSPDDETPYAVANEIQAEQAYELEDSVQDELQNAV